MPTGLQGSPAAITARSVKISPAVAGKCLPPPEADPAAVFGQVASVSGNTFAVNSLGPDGQIRPITVTVTDATAYSKDAVTNDQAITDGKCMAAQGTQADGGLQATAISLQPCPPVGGGHRRHLPAVQKLRR